MPFAPPVTITVFPSSSGNCAMGEMLRIQERKGMKERITAENALSAKSRASQREALYLARSVVQHVAVVAAGIFYEVLLVVILRRVKLRCFRDLRYDGLFESA